ncbi:MULTISPECIES: hypothetical protein [Streptomyces]|uniref:hypothetical protein n=1 Tax=Streptomyces TaxID=1883 RepID=UPI0004CC359C|nr:MULTISPECIES: hypothetical protein [Streptomyces]QHF95109.1 hypothetical protein DEH18_15965 [Streptomyces sp. NHF165]
MGWQTRVYGESHEGRPAAVLEDGSEPPPARPDGDGGGAVPGPGDWRICDGRAGASRATRVRAACACGWRGADAYPITRDADGDPCATDLSGVYQDWADHIQQVEARTVPLPLELEGLMQALEEKLESLTVQAPTAALKAVTVLERVAQLVGRDAATIVRAQGIPAHRMATALGRTEKEARALLQRHSSTG